MNAFLTGEISDCLPERRAPDNKACAMIDDVNERINARLDDGDERMNRIESKLNANCNDTAEILDILRLGKSFFRIVGGIGSIIKWTAAIVAPVLVVWYTIKNGRAP